MAGLGIVVGNPREGSRTAAVAHAVAEAAGAAAGVPTDDPLVVELAPLAPSLFDWSSPQVRDVVTAVQDTSLLVVASPTFKATYTGLLKAFLDWFDAGSLGGTAAVPVMVGAGAAHALAVEVHLRPLLVELGASVPTAGLYVTEDRLDDLPGVIDPWIAGAGPRLRAVVSA